MSEQTIRDAIYTILSGVADIGVVYKYEHWTSDYSQFLALFKTTISGVDQVRGWEVGLKAPLLEESNHVGRLTYSIRGYLRVNDELESELTFAALVEAVRLAFRTNVKLNDTAINCNFLSVDVLEVRTFGGVLCHYAEMTLPVYETVASP